MDRKVGHKQKMPDTKPLQKNIMHLLFTVTIILPVIAAAISAPALEVPPRPQGRVSDYTDTLSGRQIRDLEQKLAQFEQETTNQVVAVLIPTLAGDNLEDYSIRLAEKWKIGQKGKDNGVILLIVKGDRKIRIEVGYGLEGVLPDGLAGQIIRENIAPHFRRGNFYSGIEEGVSKIIAAIKGEYRPAIKVVYPGKKSIPWDLIFWFAAIIVIMIIVIVTLRAQAGKDGRGHTVFGGGGGFGGGFSGGGGGFGGGGASGSW